LFEDGQFDADGGSIFDAYLQFSGRLSVRCTPDTVEKLRFEISGDFICDLSVI